MNTSFFILDLGFSSFYSVCLSTKLFHLVTKPFIIFITMNSEYFPCTWNYINLELMARLVHRAFFCFNDVLCIFAPVVCLTLRHEAAKSRRKSSEEGCGVRWDGLWWIFNAERLSRVNPAFCSRRVQSWRDDGVRREEPSKVEDSDSSWSACSDDKTSTQALKRRRGRWPVVTQITNSGYRTDAE